MWLRRAVHLVALTMAYNAVETGVALWAGFRAGSVALVGFGLDSLIELAAAGAVLTRVRAQAAGAGSDGLFSVEERVRRFVGVTFLALALYVVGYALWSVLARVPPSESSLGIALAGASLVLMPLLAAGKLRAADAIGSRALAAEAKETLACSYLSFCLLLGLGLNAWLGWWWADPAGALLMVPWLVWEGMEAFEEEQA